MKVAVVGASGLVGATLVEYLLGRPGIDVVPLIHSSGNAWRLTAQGINCIQFDVLSASDVQSSLAGCTHVVNCTRGDDPVMFRGLKNLVKHSARHRVEKFVHLSSVAIYGDPPGGDSVSESGQTNPQKKSYGWLKLKQDVMVQQAAKKGLPAVILCPPNILGPYSYFLMQVLDSLVKGRFYLVDSGQMPCCTVDVRNLSHAILLALQSDRKSAERYFVTDDTPVTWANLVDELRAVVDVKVGIGSIERSAVQGFRTEDTQDKLSLRHSLKHLISSDVREALRKDPLLEKLDISIRTLVSKFGSGIEDKLRLSIEGPLKVQANAAHDGNVDTRLALQQIRGVQHSCRRAADELGYAPIVSFDQSMAAFREWYREVHGVGAESSDLAQYLYS